MAEIFAAAELRIQTEPVCEPASAAVTVSPVARSPRLERGMVRASLGVPSDEAMIVVSMGGVPWNYGEFTDFNHSRRAPGSWFPVDPSERRAATGG